MNKKGFIPIIFIVIGAIVIASAVFGIIKYKDEIAANVSKIFTGTKVEIPAEETELIEEPVIEEPAEEPEEEPEAEEIGPICGNKICGPGENCSNCATDCVCACSSDIDCNDSNSCTTDACQDPGTAQASCSNTAITSCTNNDGCCPSGCNSTNDNSCTAACGNGTCEVGENCSNCSADCGCTGEKTCISEKCVKVECTSDADCDDENECTKDTCVDNSCWNQCVMGQTCDDDNSLTVNDICFIWGAECTCKGITVECYNNSDCNDDNPCTTDTCNDAGTEDAGCGHFTITSCANDDGCCSSSCNATNDNDCEADCGNEICEIGESHSNCSQDCLPQCKDDIDNDEDGKIDYSLYGGDPGCTDPNDDNETNEFACYKHTDCMTSPCEVYVCEYVGTIDATCVFDYPITACSPIPDGYDCCPLGCTSFTDPDCQ